MSYDADVKPCYSVAIDDDGSYNVKFEGASAAHERKIAMRFPNMDIGFREEPDAAHPISPESRFIAHNEKTAAALVAQGRCPACGDVSTSEHKAEFPWHFR